MRELSPEKIHQASAIAQRLPGKDAQARLDVAARSAEGPQKAQEGVGPFEPMPEGANKAPGGILVGLTCECNELQVRLSAAERVNAALRQEKEELEYVVEGLKGQVVSLNAKVEALQRSGQSDNLADLLSDRIAREERQVNDCNLKIAECRAALGSLHAALDTATENLEALRRLLAEVQPESGRGV